MRACWIKIRTLHILLIKVRYVTLECLSLVIIGVHIYFLNLSFWAYKTMGRL